MKPRVSQGGGITAPSYGGGNKQRHRQVEPGRGQQPPNHPNRPNKPNQQGHKKQNAGGGKGGGNRQKARGLFAPGELLEGPRLRKAIQQMVMAQIRPGMRQANRSIHEIEKEREQAVSKEKNLGLQAGANIASYYQKLAEEQTNRLNGVDAANQQAKGAIAQSGKETLAGIQTAGQQDTAGIGSWEGQPIGSRAELAKMIALQGATAAQQNNALNAEAAQKGDTWHNFLSAEGMAGQQRGGEILGDTGRQVLGNIQQIKQEAGRNISKARAAKLELMAQHPELFAKALSELRESERNFLLSKGALGLEKKKLNSEEKGKTGGVAYSNVNTANQIKYMKLKIAREEKKRLREIEVLGGSEAEREAVHNEFREKEIAAEERISNKGGKSGAGGWQPYGKVFSYLRSSPFSPKMLTEGYKGENRTYTGKQARKQAYDKLRAYGASDKVAKKAIRTLVKRYKNSPKRVKGWGDTPWR